MLLGFAPLAGARPHRSADAPQKGAMVAAPSCASVPGAAELPPRFLVFCNRTALSGWGASEISAPSTPCQAPALQRDQAIFRGPRMPDSTFGKATSRLSGRAMRLWTRLAGVICPSPSQFRSRTDDALGPCFMRGAVVKQRPLPFLIWRAPILGPSREFPNGGPHYLRQIASGVIRHGKQIANGGRLLSGRPGSPALPSFSMRRALGQQTR